MPVMNEISLPILGWKKLGMPVRRFHPECLEIKMEKNEIHISMYSVSEPGSSLALIPHQLHLPYSHNLFLIKDVP
jgi:hypothetical protein